jgi:small RNA 2'-O-methyltransferase
MTSELHAERLDTIVQALLDCGAHSVLDLGCGRGDLLQRLAAQAQFTRIVGIDIDQHALGEARLTLGLGVADYGARIQVRFGSFEEPDAALAGFDAAVLVETIEHIDPRRLSRVEGAVFGSMRPRAVLVTTPNQEYNVLHGMAPGQRRHPGHHFEWTRSKFRQWAAGVAARRRYDVEFIDVGPPDAQHGSTTQMAKFIAAR